jgi:cytidylate kinase
MLERIMNDRSHLDLSKRGLVVAIDGPAGAGKSTLARAVAQELRLPYVNTGLMYRALAARALSCGVSADDEDSLSGLAREIDFVVSPGEGGSLRIDGLEPDASLESRQVEEVVSKVARHPEVRAILRREQRVLGGGGCVMEGRDIGSVVFPDADVKIFLSADPAVRAGRRSSERGGGDAVAARDGIDSRTNPLEPAPDAYVLDSTSLDAEAVRTEALRLIRRRLAGSPQ